jgi:hypothetical protein
MVVAHLTRAPVPGATVSIVGGPDAGESTTTDASGMFIFKGLQQSSCIVKVSAADYFATSAPITSNQTQTIFLIETGPTIVLAGQVIDATTSAPIPGATVDINGRYRTSTDNS